MPDRRPVLLTLIALVSTGCGGGSGTPSAPPPAASAPPPVVQSAPAAPKPTPKPSAPVVASRAAEPKKHPPGTMLVGGGEPNALVIPREQREELFAYVANPQPGMNSTLVTVTVDSPASAYAVTPPSLPAGFVAIAGAGSDGLGYPLRIRCEKDGSTMALVSGGIGVQGVDGGPPSAGPRHPIDVDPFYIDIHEVTVEQFNAWRNSVKSDKTAAPPAPSNNGRAQQPAVGIIWRDASQYAKWAGKELPTESEWEKAARGTKGLNAPWGDGRPIWERSRSVGQIDDVGSFRADESPYGVLDMAGNAREWCNDWYADDSYKQFAANTGAAARNWPGPKVADKQSRRVVKGGAEGWELWRREGLAMKDGYPSVGFRCVLRLTGANSGKSTSTAGAATQTPPPTPRTPERTPPQKSAF